MGAHEQPTEAEERAVAVCCICSLPYMIESEPEPQPEPQRSERTRGCCAGEIRRRRRSSPSSGRLRLRLLAAGATRLRGFAAAAIQRAAAESRLVGGSRCAHLGGRSRVGSRTRIRFAAIKVGCRRIATCAESARRICPIAGIQLAARPSVNKRSLRSFAAQPGAATGGEQVNEEASSWRARRTRQRHLPLSRHRELVVRWAARRRISAAAKSALAANERADSAGLGGEQIWKKTGDHLSICRPKGRWPTAVGAFISLVG